MSSKNKNLTLKYARKNDTQTSLSEMEISFCAALLELTSVGIETLVVRLSSVVTPFICHRDKYTLGIHTFKHLIGYMMSNGIT